MRDAWPVLLGLLAIPVLMWLVDAIPGRSFYSRRAFEPPVRTYHDLQAEVDEYTSGVERTPLRGEVHRLGPVGRGLPQPTSRELEWYE